jgi:hypothetical protein
LSPLLLTFCNWEVDAFGGSAHQCLLVIMHVKRGGFVPVRSQEQKLLGGMRDVNPATFNVCQAHQTPVLITDKRSYCLIVSAAAASRRPIGDLYQVSPQSAASVLNRELLLSAPCYPCIAHHQQTVGDAILRTVSVNVALSNASTRSWLISTRASLPPKDDVQSTDT